LQTLAYAIPIIPIFEIVIAVLLDTGLANRHEAVHLGLFIILLGLVSYYAPYILNLYDCKCFWKIVDLHYGTWHFVMLAVIFILNVFYLFERKKIRPPVGLIIK